MTDRTREILMSDQDWSEVYRACIDAEIAHKHEGSCLFPQFSRFEDNLTPIERAWFRVRS